MPFFCCKWEDQNKLNTEFLDTLSQLMGDADEHQNLMNNARIHFQERSQTHCSNMLYSAPYVYKKTISIVMYCLFFPPINNLDNLCLGEPGNHPQLAELFGYISNLVNYIVQSQPAN